jgi:hypothetical protein
LGVDAVPRLDAATYTKAVTTTTSRATTAATAALPRFALTIERDRVDVAMSARPATEDNARLRVAHLERRTVTRQLRTDTDRQGLRDPLSIGEKRGVGSGDTVSSHARRPVYPLLDISRWYRWGRRKLGGTCSLGGGAHVELRGPGNWRIWIISFGNRHAVITQALIPGCYLWVITNSAQF